MIAADERSGWRISLADTGPDSAVSWWTITSGSAAATARATASGSSASATTGRAPRERTRSRFEALLVIPTTSWPPSHELGDEHPAEGAGGAGYEDLHDRSFRLVLRMVCA